MAVRIGRYFDLNIAVAKLWRLGVGVLAIAWGLTPAGWGAQAPIPAQASPAGSSNEPAALPANSPELISQDVLRKFLAKMEPDRLTTLTTENLDRNRTNLRIKVLEPGGATDDLEDAYLFYLTKFAPDPKDFLDVLFRLSTTLEQRDDDSGLLTLTFDLADNFPANQLAVEQIRVIQAEYMLHLREPEAALVILHKMADQAGGSPSLQMLAAGRAGYLHENLGQTDLAIQYYLKAGEDLTAGTLANEAQLRGSLLLLELGRTDEALASLPKLRNVPPDILRQSATAPVISEITDLVADPVKARAYWSHQDKWLPQWNTLSQELGVRPSLPDDPLLDSYIDSYANLNLATQKAFNQKDVAAYFSQVDKLFQSARWLPSDLGNATSLLYQGIPLVQNHADEILALGELLEKDLPDANKDLYEQLTQLRVAALVDVGKATLATDPSQAGLHKYAAIGRDAAQVVLQKYGTTSVAGLALARLYGFAVLNCTFDAKFSTDAARILADSLVDPTAHGNQRPLAILVLNDLYTSLGRDDEARVMLQKELSTPGPTDPNDPSIQYRTLMQNDLNNLQQRSVISAGLDAGLTVWWSNNQLPWYTYVNSKPQSGPLSTVDDPAVQVARDFASALDSSKSLPARAVALEDAWSPFPEMLLTGAAVVDATNSFTGRQEMPVDLRYDAWSKAVLHLLWTGQADNAKKLLDNAPSGGANAADDRADFELWLDYLSHPHTVETQQSFADKILALPLIHHTAALLIVRIVNTMASLNVGEAAQDVFDKFGQAKLDDEATKQYHDVHDSIAPMLATYKAVQPLSEALRKLIIEDRPQAAAAAQLPDKWRNLNDILDPNLNLLTGDEVRQGLLAIIRDRLDYGRHPLQVYLDYGEALSFSPEDNALRQHIFETAQNLASRDDDRFYAALFTSIVDFDDPATATRGWADLAPARAPNFPKTNYFLQYYDLLMKWRLGDSVDPTIMLDPPNAQDVDPFWKDKMRLALDYFLQHNDKAALQKLIDSRKEEDFLQVPILSSYIRALQMLSKDAALTRATEAARLEVAKAVVQSWARPDIDSADPVFDLARALNDPAAYPRNWINALLVDLRNENSRDLLKMADGRLQADWTNVLTAANSYLTRNPTNYDAYWPKAEALVGLGRRHEAIEPLRIYVKYSHNEDEYPQAVELLQKLEAEPTTPATTAQAGR